jgi:hypothetical protein
MKIVENWHLGPDINGSTQTDFPALQNGLNAGGLSPYVILANESCFSYQFSGNQTFQTPESWNSVLN